MDRVQPDVWCCLWVWNASVCIVVALRGAGNFSHVEYEAGCSLIITSTQMKAEDPYTKELVSLLSYVQSSV